MRRFLAFIIVCVALCVGAQTREELLAEEMALNAPGTEAADFEMLLESGDTVRLSALRGREVLLVLFDADCPHCAEVMAALPPDDGTALRLAVYANGDADLWPRACAQAREAGCTPALDLTGIYDAGLYTPLLSPGLYWLSPEGTVLRRTEE